MTYIYIYISTIGADYAGQSWNLASCRSGIRFWLQYGKKKYIFIYMNMGTGQNQGTPVSPKTAGKWI